MRRLAILAISIALVVVVFHPRLGVARHGPETGALRAIAAIHAAEVQYSSQYGHYATSLGELRGMIDDDLAAGEHLGYRFTLASAPGSYQIHAVPEDPRYRAFDIPGLR